MKKIILSLTILLSLGAAKAQVVVVHTAYRRPVVTPVYVAPRMLVIPAIYVELIVRPAVMAAPIVVPPVAVARPIPVRRVMVARRRALYYR